MDYTPISTRRVLLAFAFTGFVALLPVLFFVLRSGPAGPLTDAEGHPGLLAGAGSVVLTASVVGAGILVTAIGRRLVRRPTRA